MLLPLSSIRTDGGTQPRAIIDTDMVAEYVTAMIEGAAFPEITVFYDGSDHWLADGFHRYAAAEAGEFTDIPADVRQGTRRDAVLFSVGANAAHGLRRTNDDKRRAVKTLLNDPEWSEWPTNQIARQCGVGFDMVHRLRQERPVRLLETRRQPSPAVPAAVQKRAEEIREAGGEPRYFQRGGTTSVMDVAKIGERPQPDRPAFDNTPAGRDTPPPAPQRPSPPARLWTEEQAEIHHNLEAAVTAILRMPPPEQAARDLPQDLQHEHPPAAVISAAVWLSAFAEIWAQGAADRQQKLTAFLERAQRLAAHV